MKKFEEINTPEELSKFMDENIYYGFVGNKGKIYDFSNFSEYWSSEYFLQSPEELLVSKHGTCWDQVELEREWFTKNNYEIKTFLLIFLVNYDNNYPTHTFLVFHKNNNWYWFENSWDQFRGIHKYESLDLLIQDIKKKHMKLSISLGLVKEENYETLNCIEFVKPKYHLNPDEYINFIINSI